DPRPGGSNPTRARCAHPARSGKADRGALRLDARLRRRHFGSGSRSAPGRLADRGARAGDRADPAGNAQPMADPGTPAAAAPTPRTPRRGVPPPPSGEQAPAAAPARSAGVAAAATPTDQIGPTARRRRSLLYAALASLAALLVVAAGIAVSHRVQPRPRAPV